MKEIYFFLGFLAFVVLVASQEPDYEDIVAREMESSEVESEYLEIVEPKVNPVELNVYQSEPISDDYNEHELQFLTSLEQLSMSNKRRSLLKWHMRPRCYFENWTAACCLNFNATFKNQPKSFNTCIETGLRFNKLQAFSALYFNDTELYEQDIELGKLCWGLPPPLSKIKTCIWVYHLDIDIKKHRFESCTLLEVSPFVLVGMNCLLFEDGKFSIHDRIKPEHKGILDISLLGGHLDFQVESPFGKRIKYWFSKEWRKFKGLFRAKSKKFVHWLHRK